MSIANVLLVDDETAFLETMNKRLTKRNFQVKTVDSGIAALETLSENGEHIEVVILDVQMPGMDGIETLTEIKRKYPLVEVIMLTGHATVASAIEGMKQGAYDYLMKPCEMEILLTKVIEAANKKRRHEQKIIEARMKEITTF
ncbi:MAG: two-component system response regulator [Desulfobacterales bacterium CG07_land_8_20_14_0_80_52_14]|nr:MAG: two-component system response regulator [Desulfobacterales bacterium CG23_combo_of_CG06-09_8_20_14_all_52_9]PIU50478.1 MAG: two-component system response regulator [Desulfobacterales bacterium CG07_land_8_20_14_0_80_52_14]